MSHILVLVGPPCSGKTTWARKHMQEEPLYMHVSKDNLRRMLEFKAHLNVWGEQIVQDVMDYTIQKILDEGDNVILDNCHCHISYIKEVIRKWSGKAEIRFKTFDVLPFETLMERNKSRAAIEGFGEVPVTNMWAMHQNYKELLRTYNFEDVKQKQLTLDYQ